MLDWESRRQMGVLRKGKPAGFFASKVAGSRCMQQPLGVVGTDIRFPGSRRMVPGAQVSVFDTINAAGGYSRRVRRLGEFHPALARIKSPDGQDIDDPLYGNLGGAAEKARTRLRLADKDGALSGAFLPGSCCLWGLPCHAAAARQYAEGGVSIR